METSDFVSKFLKQIKQDTLWFYMGSNYCASSPGNVVFCLKQRKHDYFEASFLFLTEEGKTYFCNCSTLKKFNTCFEVLK